MKNEHPKGTKTESLRWRLTLVSLALLTWRCLRWTRAIYIGVHQRYYSDLKANTASVSAHARVLPPQSYR